MCGCSAGREANTCRSHNPEYRRFFQRITSFSLVDLLAHQRRGAGRSASSGADAIGTIADELDESFVARADVRRLAESSLLACA
jgi:hypothetical protein